MTAASRLRKLREPACRGACGLLLASWLLNGCGSKPASPAQPGAAKPATNVVATVGTNSSSARTNLLIGEFIDDPKLGQDPFFPKSVRRSPPTAVPAAGVVLPDKVEKASVWSNLVLKAILGTKTRRLASVNRTTFGVGEVATVKYPGGSVRIKCLEIKNRSVVIEANGEQKELFFRDAKK